MKPDVMHNLRFVALVGLFSVTGALAQNGTTPNAGPELLPGSAAPAQAAPPLVPLPAAPNEILPTSPTPATPALPSSTPVLVTPAPLPTTLERVSASLKAVQTGPNQGDGELTLNLTLLNGQAKALAFSAGRDSAQNCAAAPLLRVLRVGTREVVYPVAGEKRICTQELIIKTALLGGSTVFSRTLKLAPGDYVVESWFQGFAGPMQSRVRLSAPPLRVSIR